MENNQKTSKGIYGVIVLLVIIILGMGVYLLYDKEIIFTKNKDKEESREEQASSKTDEDKTESDQNQSKNSLKVLSGSYADSATTVIVHHGDVYVSFEPCPVNFGTYNGMYNDYCTSLNNLINSYQEYSLDGLEYEAINVSQSYRYSRSLNSHFLGLKINISNVKSAYSVMQGQSLIPSKQGLAFLKEDGTLSVISFQNIVSNQLSPASTNLSNITEVRNENGEGAISTVAIDSSGNTHNLSEYFQ